MQNHSQNSQLLGLIYQWNEIWGHFVPLQILLLTNLGCLRGKQLWRKAVFLWYKSEMSQKNWRNKVKLDRSTWDLESWAIFQIVLEVLWFLDFRVNLTRGVSKSLRRKSKRIWYSDMDVQTQGNKIKKIRNPYKLSWKQTAQKKRNGKWTTWSMFDEQRFYNVLM